MQTTPAPLEGLLIITPRLFHDERGYFYESFHRTRYAEAGLPPFLQDNHSLSKKNVVRGLHYQKPHAQGKLVFVTRGKVWDVVVDIRRDSKTFGQWFSIELSDENHAQLYIPPGFAHGFCTLSDEADFAYKCTDVYTPGTEHGIRFDDPDINIPWPTTTPILSDKDKTYPRLADIPREHLFP
ncbi:MAG TPA: dTDP-4-dehydrorhamnose 3,5-epimerase [Gammaproteobacteria bacterium]|nr:dTDP-4-dehydrorhamnose 3,5-epimerase [Gammaproteobacteria bacterium]